MAKYISSLFLVIIFSCGQSGDSSLVEEFIIKPGFKIELIAAEPLLQAPVDIDWDQKGNIWAVELTGYMRDIDGGGEDIPDGKVVMLSDTDGDGKMDVRKVVVDGLIAPRALALVYNGILYSDDTKLWWQEMESETRILVDSNYVTGSNIEHQPNGLIYHIDNWIYSARCKARYRMKNGAWIKEPTSFRGQWGMSGDDYGRLYYNDNSNLLRGDALLPNQLIQNHYLEIQYGVGRRLTDDQSVYPLQPTSVNRGYQKGVLDPDGKLLTATSSCGPVIYRGLDFPAEYYGDAFVCVPEINGIKHLDIQEINGRAIAQHVDTISEFLVSKDETFRPVNLFNGPDGAMYVVDLRKGIIQHRAYMTDYLRENILDKGLEKVVGRGRIYRISHEEESLKNIDLSLLDMLTSPGGHVRLMAQQQLVFDRDTTLFQEIKSIATNNSYPFGQLHALWTLEGLGILDKDLLLEAGRSAKDPILQAHLLKLGLDLNLGQDIGQLIAPVSRSENDFVNLELSHAIGLSAYYKKDSIWLDLANRYGYDTLFSEALVSGIGGREDYFIAKLGSASDSLSGILQRTINWKNKEIVQAPSFDEVDHDGRTAGFNLYNTYCSSCHRMDGKGQKNLAPPLINSFLLEEDPEKSALIILQGIQGPVSVSGRRYDMKLMMPGLKTNPNLEDRDIADIVHFIRNAFVAQWTSLDSTDVKALRAMVAKRNELFTEAELEAMCFD
jgi:mono/diheme cytochrome c family protein